MYEWHWARKLMRESAVSLPVKLHYGLRKWQNRIERCSIAIFGCSYGLSSGMSVFFVLLRVGETYLAAYYTYSYVECGILHYKCPLWLCIVMVCVQVVKNNFSFSDKSVDSYKYLWIPSQTKWAKFVWTRCEGPTDNIVFDSKHILIESLINEIDGTSFKSYSKLIAGHVNQNWSHKTS